MHRTERDRQLVQDKKPQSVFWNNDLKTISFKVPGKDGPSSYDYTIELTAAELDSLFLASVEKSAATSGKELLTAFLSACRSKA